MRDGIEALTAEALTDKLGSAAPFAETWDTNDAEQNVLLYPATAATVQMGPLASVRGGLVSDTSLRARVSAVVGPGATPRGIARRLLPLYTRAATSAHPGPTEEQLARGILVYNRYFLPVPAMRGYEDGLRIPLPIEIDRTNGNWILNANAIRLWTRSFQAAWQPLLDRRPARLDTPDPSTLPGQVRTFLSAQTTPLARGIHLQARVMTNPFKEVFFFFEAMRQLAAGAFAVALVFLDHSVNHQARLLASLTAGSAILQRLVMSLRTSPTMTDQQRASLRRGAQMLDSALRPGGTRVQPRELPETRQQLANRPGGIGRWQQVSATDPTGGSHRLVLGRDVLAGRISTSVIGGHTYHGPAYGGRISPAAFIAANANLLNPTSNARLAARLRIVQAIVVNEGFLDAVRLRDRGILSVGMQQWSAHVDIELPSLLQRYARMAPDEFILFFNLHALGIRPFGTDGHGNPRFRLQRIRPNGTRVDLDTWQRRRDFFGGRTAGTTTTFGTEWAARCRLPAIASIAFRVAQVLQAAGRLDRVVREVGSINVAGTATPLTTLITSERGVAMILDAHINLPGHVLADLQAAANAVGPQPNANALDQAITNRYAVIRRTHNTPVRTANINAQGLDPNHGTFSGW